MSQRARVAVIVMVTLLGGVAAAAPPRPVEFPPPTLSTTVSPVAMGLERPRLDPPAPTSIATPELELGRAPAPRFISTVTKPLPTSTDPGGFACAFIAF